MNETDKANPKSPTGSAGRIDTRRPPYGGSTTPLIGFGLLIVVLALVVRGLIYVRVEDVLHADEALQGLIARHIRGGQVQLFTYGQPYLGALQAHWILVCFALFGATTAVLKWAAGIESLLLILATYLLAREVCGGDRRAGFFAALLTAIGPLYLVEWSLRPRGGHVETATLSALALWALLRAIRAAQNAGDGAGLPGGAVRWATLCAFLLGVGWWVHLTMFYAMVACVVGTILWGGRLRADARVWIASLVCFFIGSLPFWLFNLVYRGRTFVHVWDVVRGTHGPSPFDRIVHLLHLSAPILLGSRQTEAAASFGGYVVLVSMAAYIVALAGAIGSSRTAATPPSGAEAGVSDAHRLESLCHIHRLESLCHVRREGVNLLLLFAVVGLVVFLVGPFAEPARARDPNGLLPLYAALLPLAAAGMADGWLRGGMKRNGAILTLVVLLLLHVHGYRRAEREVIQPYAQEYRVPADLDTLKVFLEAHGIGHIFTNYYLGYRLAFETGEEIIPYTNGDPIPERYMPYAEAVEATSEPVAFVVGTRAADWLRAALIAKGITFKEETKIQGFHVLYNLSAPYRDYPPGIHLAVPAAIVVGPYSGQCRPGETFRVPTTVINNSAVSWPPPPSWRTVRLSYHIYDAGTGETVQYDGARFELENDLAPGSSVTLTLAIAAPEMPGRYVFIADLVIDGVAWLSVVQPDLVGEAARREFVVVE